MAADVVAIARRYREAARRRDSEARRKVAAAYAIALRSIDADVRKIIALVEAQRRSGEPVSERLLVQLREYGEMRSRTRAALLRAAGKGLTITDANLAREYALAHRDAHKLIGSKPNAVDDVALVNLRGVLSRGPLLDRIRTIAGDDADAIVEEMTTGLIRGRSTKDTLDAINKRVAGSSEWHLKTILTTESHRARREAQRKVYIDSPFVDGYVWICSLTPGSCGYCWRQHGQVFRTAVVMATHPNCACEIVPWREGDSFDKGVDLFDALTPDEQDEALGSKAAGRAYRDGAVTLDDLCKVGIHPDWGPTGVQRSLVGALGPGAARYYPRASAGSARTV